MDIQISRFTTNGMGKSQNTSLNSLLVNPDDYDLAHISQLLETEHTIENDQNLEAFLKYLLSHSGSRWEDSRLCTSILLQLAETNIWDLSFKGRPFFEHALLEIIQAEEWDDYDLKGRFIDKLTKEHSPFNLEMILNCVLQIARHRFKGGYGNDSRRCYDPTEQLGPVLTCGDFIKQIDGYVEWIEYTCDPTLALLGAALEHHSKKQSPGHTELFEAISGRLRNLSRKNEEWKGFNKEVSNPVTRIPNATELTSKDHEALLAPLIRGNRCAGFRAAMELGCSPNVPCLDGRPVYMIVLDRDSNEIEGIRRELLLDKGIDMTLLDADGKSFLDHLVSVGLKYSCDYRALIAKAIDQGCSLDKSVLKKQPAEWVNEILDLCSDRTATAVLLGYEFDRLDVKLDPKDEAAIFSILYKHRGQNRKSFGIFADLYEQTSKAVVEDSMRNYLVEEARSADIVIPKELFASNQAARNFLIASRCTSAQTALLAALIWRNGGLSEAWCLQDEVFKKLLEVDRKLFTQGLKKILSSPRDARSGKLLAYLRDDRNPKDDHIVAILLTACGPKDFAALAEAWLKEPSLLSKQITAQFGTQVMQIAHCHRHNWPRLLWPLHLHMNVPLTAMKAPESGAKATEPGDYARLIRQGWHRSNDIEYCRRDETIYSPLRDLMKQYRTSIGEHIGRDAGPLLDAQRASTRVENIHNGYILKELVVNPRLLGYENVLQNASGARRCWMIHLDVLAREFTNQMARAASQSKIEGRLNWGNEGHHEEFKKKIIGITANYIAGYTGRDENSLLDLVEHCGIAWERLAKQLIYSWHPRQVACDLEQGLWPPKGLFPEDCKPDVQYLDKVRNYDPNRGFGMEIEGAFYFDAGATGGQHGMPDLTAAEHLVPFLCIVLVKTV